jgi:simple sugar transport system permease protein
LPAGMRYFAHTNLLRVEASDGSLYQLPAAFLALVVIVVGIWFLLSRTTLGRSIFAMGGSSVSAERVGINVVRLQYFVYGLVGAISGVAGIVHASLEDIASPFELVGLELSVIAAVVLGGARISGGHGSIVGALLGVALITVMNNTLIMWHIPSTWQNVVVGVLILVGAAIPAIRSRRRVVLS